MAPTGSGKSIGYWIPGIVNGGLTIVISPLIALMVDQVARLNELGIPAACLHSQVSAAARAESMRAAAASELRFLYLAPERIGAPGFLEGLRRLAVERFVVDEAHCISSWGHDFRPEYRRLGEAIAACGRPPVGAFTATATPRVREDIATSLGLRAPVERVTGFVRDNLTMSVIRCRGVADKRDAVLRLVRPGGGRALIYCGSRRTTDAITDVLAGAGVAVASYHGALDGDARQSVHEGFASGRLQAIVATSAFGMGVDFPDIRRVIHHDFPGSLTAGRRVLTYADLRATRPGTDPRPPSRDIILHLTGNMGRFIWGFDGKKYSEAEPIVLQRGERVRFVLINDTMMEHPIHLHGLWSELENGYGEFRPYKHTINIKPGERLSYLVTADTPGRWAFHCHLLYHMEMGMFREVRVV